jgi:hypothetical protein
MKFLRPKIAACRREAGNTEGFLHFHMINLIGILTLIFIGWFLWQSWKDGTLQSKFNEFLDMGRSSAQKVIDTRSFR